MIRTGVVGLVLLSILAASAGAFEVAPGWIVEQFTVKHGLPVDSVNDLEWTPDGYLWIATYDGLARFDGHRFTVYSSSTDRGMPGNRILRIRADRHGNLWIAIEPNRLVVRFASGAFADASHDPRLPGSLVHCLERDPNGDLLVCTDDGVAAIREGRIERLPIAEGRDVRTLLADSQGRIWTHSLGPGVEVWHDGKRAGHHPSLEALVIREGPDGAVLAGAVDGLWRLSPSPAARLAAVEVIHEVDHDGDSIVLQASGAFLRFDGTALRQIEVAGYTSKSRGLTAVDSEERRWLHTRNTIRADGEVVISGSRLITAVVAGEEGTVWAGTGEGLLRIRRSLVRTALVDTLPDASFYPIVADGDSILAGTLSSGWVRFDPDSGAIETHTLPDNVRTFARDAAGELWVGGGGELCRASGTQCLPSGAPFRIADVFALHTDRSGALWAATPGALFRRDRDGSWRRFGRAEGIPPRIIRVIVDALGSGLWLGTAGDGMLRYDEQRFRRYTTADGLPSDLIRSLLMDGDGSLWVGSENLGLARVRTTSEGLEVTAVHAGDGLFDDTIHQIVDDRHGRLWMSSNRGIFWIAKMDLDDFVEGRSTHLRSMFYDERHGMLSREANGGNQSAGTLDSRGIVWFPTQKGIVGIDTNRIPLRYEPPPVRLEGLVAERVHYAASGSVSLPKRVRDMRIDYTALSFVRPELVRFRYRLDGFDTDWTDAGERREAFYTNVPPGRYAFRAGATHDDQSWSELSTPLTVVIPSLFWETRWFRAALLGALLVAIAALVWWRTRRLAWRKRELEDLVVERTHELESAKAKVESALARVAEIDRLKSRFFADVSHELRTPLTMILGPLHDLIDGDVEPEQRHNRLAMMRRNALRLLRLVNQILDLHRLEAGGLELQRTVRDLRPVVQRVAESFTPLAERSGIELRSELTDAPLPVSHDAEQIEKVVANLLSNAVKFTPRGGSIAVELEQHEARALLRISNSGTGIAAHDVSRVFDRYYRGSVSALQEGSGIGLALVRELVEIHEGTVTVSSTPGEQTTFTVSLALESRDEIVAEHEDLQPDPGSASAPAITASLRSGAHPPTILIVEDNADVQQYVHSVLERDYRILLAHDGRDGLDKARRFIPDLVVSDVMMPGMDGFQLATELRRDPMTEPVPLILLTARATSGDEVEGLRTGADDYLAKPFSPDVLRARVATILGRRARLRDRLMAELSAPPAADNGNEPFDARLRHAFERQLHDDSLSIESLAAELAMSRSTFMRQVQKTFGRSPRELLLDWRLERSAALLRSNDASVSEIACATGFRSLAHFSRAFNARFGVAPSHWRARDNEE